MLMKDLGNMPKRKYWTEECGGLKEKDIIHNQLLSQIELIPIDEALRKNGWVRKMSVNEIYKFLKSIDGCNIKHLDTDWCESVNVKDLATALSEAMDKL